MSAMSRETLGRRVRASVVSAQQAVSDGVDSPPSPAVLSNALRLGDGPLLAQRRAVVALSLTAMGAMGVITLYQMGITKRIPDPLHRVWPYFDAARVDASANAYAKLASPDGALGLGSYAATLALAAMGGPERASTQPWLPLALAAKVALDLALAGKLTVDQFTKEHALCMWCLLAAGATLTTAPLVAQEAWVAARNLLGR